MKNFYNILKKEIKELLTKQMILGLVFMIIMFGIMGNFMKGLREKDDELINLAVLDLDKSQYSEGILDKLSKQKTIEMAEITEIDIEKAIKQAKEKEAKVLLVVPENFEEDIKIKKRVDLKIYSIIKGLSIKGMISDATVNAIIGSINREISINFIQEAFPDKNPEDIINPLNIKEFVVIKDKMTSGDSTMIESLAVSQSIMIPIILMMLIIYAGGTIVTSMVSEKENKTLETLLTLPVKRISIVIGKMTGATIVALLMAGVFLGGFRYYMSSAIPDIPGSETILEDLGLTMTPLSYILLGISLFLAILIALSMSMILGIFAQSTKNAHIMNMPIVLLAMIPYFLLMFQDAEMLSLPMKIFLYAIPFAHPIIASKALIFHNYPIVLGGIAYMIIFAAVTMYVAVWLFNTDRVLTAKFSLKKLRIKKLKRG